MKLNNLGFAPIIIIGIIAGVFVAGAGVTVASNSSKPGDTLYSLDRAAENIQLALAFTNGSKKDVRASLAAERLEELDALMAEDELDVEAINDVTDEYNKHRSVFDDMSDDDGTIDEHEQKLENELDDKKSDIDKLAEAEQATLENQREDLKQEYEDAVKSGDTDKATQLQSEINSFEDQLNELEDRRESEKQDTEDSKDTEDEAKDESSDNSGKDQEDEPEDR